MAAQVGLKSLPVMETCFAEPYGSSFKSKIASRHRNSKSKLYGRSNRCKTGFRNENFKTNCTVDHIGAKSLLAIKAFVVAHVGTKPLPVMKTLVQKRAVTQIRTKPPRGQDFCTKPYGSSGRNKIAPISRNVNAKTYGRSSRSSSFPECILPFQTIRSLTAERNRFPWKRLKCKTVRSLKSEQLSLRSEQNRFPQFKLQYKTVQSLELKQNRFP